MKKFIIWLFGGYTEEQLEEIESELKQEKVARANERKYLFRAGDQVYINNKRFNPSVLYYLIESYNNGYAWYVSSNKNSNTKDIMNGVSLKEIQFEKIDVCPLCKNQI